jgi:peptidoglycan/LPS O-acetylase OafA/YrhL
MKAAASADVGPKMIHDSTMSHSASGEVPPPRHIPALDGLRGMAAMLIMIFHWFQLSTAPRGAFLESAGRFASIGQTGLDLFFVLSGFLITRILLRSRSNPAYFRNFYARRVLRIFPLYYSFVIVWLLFLSPSYHIKEPVSPWWLLLYAENIRLTFVSSAMVGLSHFWSLAVEEHFYLVWPVVIYLVAPQRLGWVALAVLLVTILTRVCMIGAGYEVFFFTPCRLDGFAVGAFLAWLEMRPGGLPAFRRALLVALALFGGAAILCWILTSGRGLKEIMMVKFSLVALAYGALLGLLAGAPSASNGFASLWLNRPLRWCGMVSYGLYVFHPPCYHYTNMLPLNDWSNLLVSFVSSGLISWLSFHYFESRITALKRHLV